MSYIGNTPTSQAFAPGTDTFSGTGSQTAFTLSRSVSTVNDILVVVNNVEQQPSNYTVSGTTLTFSPAPSSGTNNIYVRYLSTNLLAVAPQQGSVVPSSLSTQNAVYWDTSGNVGIGTTSPTAKLGVVSAANTASAVFTDATQSTLTFKHEAGNLLTYDTGGTATQRWVLNSVEQARITPTGLFQFNSGFGSAGVAYGCRAWVNFNGTGTVAIRSSGNVSSITDGGVGVYTVNLTTAMPDANYSAVTHTSYLNGSYQGSQEPWAKVASTTTTAIVVYTHWHVFNVGYLAQDMAYVGVAIFR